MVRCPAIYPYFIAGATSPFDVKSCRYFISCHCLLTLFLCAGSRNCITHACECDYVMQSRKGLRKNRLPQELSSRSDSDTLGASSDDSMGISPTDVKAQVGSGRGVVAAPSSYVLPTSQHRLVHHMASIAQSIERGKAGNLVIYLKKLPT
jgi:hypothetical protein